MAEYDGRIRRLHPVPNRRELERLSPEELAQAMEQTLDQMTEDTYDQAVIDAYLDALDAKAPMPEAPDVEESYQQFQAMLFQAMLSQAMPEEEPPKPKRRGSVLRMTLRVALAAVFLFGCLMVAQASGVNVFGGVLRWTDNGFRFQMVEDRMPQWYDDYQSDLEAVGLQEEQLPTWLPQDYALDAIQVSKKLDRNEVQVLLTSQDQPDIRCSMSIFSDPETMSALVFSKDNRPVEEFQVNGKTVYLLHNEDTVMAVCQHQNVIYCLSGNIGRETASQFYASIPAD